MTAAYPLQWPAGWPRTAKQARKDARFDTPWTKTLDKLVREIHLLGGSSPIISSNAAVRRDGLPYADQAQDKLDDPGASVFFTINGRQRVMAHDVYKTVHHNLHSIALTIEAMRAIERHGGSMMMERAFEGFAALAAPGATPWWQILGLSSDAPRQQIEEAFRRLARVRHPDAGGSDAMMAELNAARDQALKERS